MGFCTFQKTAILTPRISFFFFGFLSLCYGRGDAAGFKGLTPVRLPPFLIREMGTQKAALAAMQHQMATPIFGSGTVIDRAVFNRGEFVGVCASVCVCVLVRVCGVGVRVRRVCL